MAALEKTLAALFSKLPALPGNVRQLVVMLAPYLALLGVLLSLPVVLFALGLGTLATPIVAVGGAWAVYGGGLLATLFGLATVILDAMAIPGLFRRARIGWHYAYLAALVGGLQNLLMGSLFGLIIGTGISLYVLFQVRERYH